MLRENCKRKRYVGRSQASNRGLLHTTVSLAPWRQGDTSAVSHAYSVSLLVYQKAAKMRLAYVKFRRMLGEVVGSSSGWLEAHVEHLHGSSCNKTWHCGTQCRDLPLRVAGEHSSASGVNARGKAPPFSCCASLQKRKHSSTAEPTKRPTAVPIPSVCPQHIAEMLH